ncbi:MAG: phosphopyruvate hydratase, partial [Candidatus Diapherotrites archaeon]|nr:phosphopyruvate hydratase [Candidatus Diapherotrites archaeon]
MSNQIIKVKARTVLDSRGNPTVEAEVWTAKGCFSAIVPSGASTGTHEAIELRDNGKEFLGRGVSKAIRNVNEWIAPKIIGMDCTDIYAVDAAIRELDESPNK